MARPAFQEIPDRHRWDDGVEPVLFAGLDHQRREKPKAADRRHELGVGPTARLHLTWIASGGKQRRESEADVLETYGSLRMGEGPRQQMARANPARATRFSACHAAFGDGEKGEAEASSLPGNLTPRSSTRMRDRVLEQREVVDKAEAVRCQLEVDTY